MKKISLSLFILGVLLSFFPHFYRWARPWRSVERVVELKAGPVLEQPFHTFHNGSYDIQLSATSSREQDQAECFLTGQSSPTNSCPDAQGQLDLEWEVLKESQVVESGSVFGGGASTREQDTITRLLGTADLEPGGDYILKVKSHGDFPQLTPFHPKVSIALGTKSFQSILMVLGFMQLMGYLFLGLSAGIFILKAKKEDPLII